MHDAKLSNHLIFQIQVRETPQKEPEKEKNTEATPSPATNKLECEKCGKVYHTRHAYHFRNHLLTCSGTTGQEQQKNTADTVTTPVTPSTVSETATSSRVSSSSGLAGTCTNCGKQYLKRNTHHYQAHILK